METKIAYADQVSNPLYAVLKSDNTKRVGTFCEKPDKDGTCQNCWAEVIALRFYKDALPFDKSNRDKIEWKFRADEMKRLTRLNAKQPRSKKFAGLPLVVFCCDTFDIFQPSISDEMRDEIFDAYDQFQNLILLIQTTYPARMNRYFNARYPNGMPKHYRIGMSAGTQDWLDKNVMFLVNTKAQFRYIIFEPLLEEIHFEPFTVNDDSNGKVFINQVIVGGESGAKPREMQLEWARHLQWECEQIGIAFFFKQESRLGNKNYSKFETFQTDLQIRQMPV